MARRIIRTPPYKDFLQAALHKRFLTTATVLIATVYVEAMLLAPWTSYLWTWFPIGPTGIRAFFLLLSGIWVLFLRIGQYHVGIRTSTSSFNCFVQNTTRMHTAEVFFAYLLSTACFWPVFLATRSSSSQMNLIQHVGADRTRLNEKPLFLGSYLALLAIAQSIYHLWKDEDRLALGCSKAGKNKTNGDDAIVQQIARSIPILLVQTLSASVIMVLINTIVYHMFLRSMIWSWTLSLTRPFYNMPRTNMLPASWPLTLTTIIQCNYSGFLLLFMWHLSNTVFSSTIVKEPLKNGQPLTSESRDPNGSLLNGLKSKKLSAKAFALWELNHISRSFPERRKAIFEDIDRKDGAMWSQVCMVCINTLKSIDNRIAAYDAPPPSPAPVQASQAVEPKRRSFAPVKEDAIFQPQSKEVTIKGELEKAIGHAITSGSQTSTGLSPMARKTLKQARDRFITKEQQESLAPEHVAGWFRKMALKVIENEYFGPFFREEFRKRFAAAVLGTPYAEVSMYINAAASLSGLVVSSLTDDKLGKVYLDVGNVVRVFTAIILNIEHFKSSFPMHWTDIEAVRECPEVNAVLDEMKNGLRAIMAEFEQYATDLRLTQTDLRLAKEACAEQPAEAGPAGERSEMREIQ
ncbi:Nucleoporin NDC1 [Ceratocystis fimbriata CBS 114723]|uniref:Nucleoporin NDC1 n=1 Tax=Ceratocystis fimbriata CBS 114723 TaxID=1035309 RepID=A0A2C5XGL4_9PEZI|nr:Nucleoporin NDC1 [Ceratocystis fimbriata CBS 114723]